VSAGRPTTVRPTAARPTAAELAVRLTFVGLVVLVVLAPEMGSSAFSYPAIANVWVALPLSGLLLAGLVDVRRRPRLAHLDLLAVCSLMVVGALDASRSFALAAAVPYAPLTYLAIRMLVIARRRPRPARPPWRPAVPVSWLACACLALAFVHVQTARGGAGTLDVGAAGVQGAQAIVHGRPLYGIDRAAARTGQDPHLDTYGPFNYEAYVPPSLLAGHRLAARLATLGFDLLTAVLLFVLGRRLGGAALGVRLTFAWLAVPLTLYSVSVSFNDGLVAATLVAALLCLDRPARRGVAIALAAWTKFTPLALVPLMLVAGRAPDRRTLVRFGAGFVATSLIVFVPAVAHDSVQTIVSRTVGFQAGRSGSASIWALFDGGISFAHPAWTTVASKVVHGLLVAATAAVAVALPRLPLRRDIAGVAAAGAAVMILLMMCVSYLALGYALWFLALALVAILAGDVPATDL
jgi:hypothetical protein